MQERRRSPANKGDAKIQRWVDLLASLLRRHFGATFEEIARDVPAYQDRRAKPDSILRTFERDKDELRAFGIPIETFTNAQDPTRVGYRLAAKEFYLPYLLAISPSKVRPTPGQGYAALDKLIFAADELEAIGRAGELVRSLGDPVLLEHCGSAMRKLAFELPLDIVARDDTAPTAPREVFEALSSALERRKAVQIIYYAIGKDETTERSVEPYGLFFTGSTWYLAARDTAHGEVRTFRVRRISGATVKNDKKHAPDYQIPRSFDLRSYAERQAWQLGDDDEREVVVDFTGESGAAAAAARLGAVIRGSPKRRKFMVRRPELFARWLLSFAGEARVESPKGVQAMVRDEAERTLALYNSRGGIG